MPDVTLRFLGGVAVTRAGVALSGRARQRRRLALLGIVAAAPDCTVSRDRVIGLLWPESDTAAARDGLNTAIYDLRVALGDAAIRSIGDDLVLDGDVVHADVAAFERAVAAGDAARAVELYRGPFLEGLFVSGAPEFERWLEATRERLRRSYRQALERLAASAASERDAADLRLRLAMDDPADGTAVREAMRLLHAGGDAAAALRLAEQHRRAAGDAGADAGVLEHAARIRASQAPGASGWRLSWPPRSQAAGFPRARFAMVLGATMALAAVLLGFRLYSTSATAHFRAGERDYRRGRYLSAVEHFRHVVRLDSTHAFGHYRLSQSILAADLPEGEASASDASALRFSEPLPERDRLLLRAYAAFRLAHPHTAARLYRNLVALYPDDVEAWHQLGETLFHYNPRRGQGILDAREPFERVLALEPSDWSARWHLAHLAAEAGDTAGFAAHTAWLLAQRPEVATALEIRALRAIAGGNRQEEQRLLPQLANSDELRLYQIAWRAAVYLNDVAGAERVAELLSRGQDAAAALGYGTRAYLSLARGRWSEATRLLSGTQLVAIPITLEARLLASLHPYAPRRAEMLDSLAAAVAQFPATPNTLYLRTLVVGSLAAASGDTVAALAGAGVLDRLGAVAREGDAVRAQLALRRGRYAQAARFAATSTDTVPWFGWAATSPIQAGTLPRWALAEALRGLGRDSAALGWYASFGEHALPDVALLAPARLRRGEIFERLGQTEAAVREYREFVRLWWDADPELQPLVADVRRRIERLTRPPRAG